MKRFGNLYVRKALIVVQLESFQNFVLQQDYGRIIAQTGGQIDILPTLANIMGIDLESAGITTFGQDLMNIDHNIIGLQYYMPTGTFINNEVLFMPIRAGFEQ